MQLDCLEAAVREQGSTAEERKHLVKMDWSEGLHLCTPGAYRCLEDILRFFYQKQRSRGIYTQTRKTLDEASSLVLLITWVFSGFPGFLRAF